jgi:hypothetical protein
MKRTEVAVRAVGVGVMIILATRMAAAQISIFRAAPTYSLSGSSGGQTPLVAIVDVGSRDTGEPDGLADLITANQDGDALVLFGNRNGTLTAGPNTSLGRVPTALAAADFDGDGFIDLLVADSGDDVFFLRGFSGGPPFKSPGPPIPAGRGPVAIAAAELNGDTELDAVVVDDGNGTTGGVTILLGNGDGTFVAGAMIQTAVGSKAVALGDFDGDEKTDLAVANAGTDDVSILSGDGSGGFTPAGTAAAGENPVAIVARDLNGDGHLDLVVLNRDSDSIAVLDGVAGGTFKPARFFLSGTAGSTPNGLAMDDVNLDGKPDLAVSNERSSDASVLLGDGSGNFSPPRVFVADLEPLAVAIGDFNDDDVPDVLTVNRGSQAPNAAVLLGQGDGGLFGVEDVVVQPNPKSVAAGDVDNDGVCDLIAAHSDGSVLVLRADPPLGFAPAVVTHSAGDVVAVGSGDFNGDGLLDVAVANQSTANVSVFLARIGGGFGDPQDYALGAAPSALVTGDWNHDGLSDLAVTVPGSGSNGTVAVLLAGPDGTLSGPVPLDVGTGPMAVDTGDFNRDGKRDLAVTNDGSKDVSVVLGNGDGTFMPATRLGVSGSPRALAVADFDRDGYDDIAVMLPVGSSVVVLYGNGQGGFSPGPQDLRLDSTPSALAARDVTGDLIPDVLVTDQVANSVKVFAAGGANRRFQGSSVGVSRQPVSVAAGDFDGDGRYDGATADGFVAGSVSVLTNISATPVRRGDANADGTVSVADAVGVMRELGDGNGTRIEELRVAAGSYSAAPGVDANGDGLVTLQDTLATAHRLFLGLF